MELNIREYMKTEEFGKLKEQNRVLSTALDKEEDSLFILCSSSGGLDYVDDFTNVRVYYNDPELNGDDARREFWDCVVMIYNIREEEGAKAPSSSSSSPDLRQTKSCDCCGTTKGDIELEGDVMCCLMCGNRYTEFECGECFETLPLVKHTFWFKPKEIDGVLDGCCHNCYVQRTMEAQGGLQ